LRACPALNDRLSLISGIQHGIRQAPIQWMASKWQHERPRESILLSGVLWHTPTLHMCWWFAHRPRIAGLCAHCATCSDGERSGLLLRCRWARLRRDIWRGSSLVSG